MRVQNQESICVGLFLNVTQNRVVVECLRRKISFLQGPISELVNFLNELTSPGN